MQALGYADYNIYGVSYGTTLGLEVMRSAPEGVRSVVLDSVSPPQARVYDENAKPVQEGMQAVLDQCAADAACAAAYPDLEAVLFRVAEQLQKTPIPAARGQPEVTIMTLIELFEDRNTYGALPNTTGHHPPDPDRMGPGRDRQPGTCWPRAPRHAPPGTARAAEAPCRQADAGPDHDRAASVRDGRGRGEARTSRSPPPCRRWRMSLKAGRPGATDLADRFGRHDAGVDRPHTVEG